MGASGMGVTPVLCTHRGLAAQRRRPVLNGFDDVHVAGAAAQVAGDTPTNLRLGRVGIFREQRLGAEEHTWRAEPALQAVLLEEALLQRVQLTVLLQAFDRLDLAAISLHGQQRAGLDGLAIEQDRACATVRRIAPDMSASKVQVLADEVDQQESGLDRGGEFRTVDAQCHVAGRYWFDAHAVPPRARSSARRSARRVSSRTMARL